MEMEWPSKRIPQGGLFHQPKASYTKETQDLIKVLMEEAKLTILQRNKINYQLRSGDPLPLVKEPKLEQDYSNFLSTPVYKKNIKRRSLQTMIETGAFEFEKYKPHMNKEPSDKLKIKLQEKMSGFKICVEAEKNPKRRIMRRNKSEQFDENNITDRIAELMKEIDERMDWLEEMEKLGEAKKHRQTINLQISDKLNEIKKLERKKG